MSPTRNELEAALRAVAVTPRDEHEVVCHLEKPWESGAGLWSCSASWLARRVPEHVWARVTIWNVPQSQLGARLLAALKAGAE